METLFDLPSHVLLIHAPIVLLPIAAMATLVMVARPGWRDRTRWWMVGAVAAVTVMVFLARESGQEFDDALEGAVDTTTHEDLANTTWVLTLLWLVSYLAMALWVQFRHRSSTAVEGRSTAMIRALPIALVALAGLFAVLATVWLVRTGHEGSRLVWEPTVDIYFQ